MKFEFHYLKENDFIEKSYKIIGPNNFRLEIFSSLNIFVNRLKNVVEFLNGVKKDLNKKERRLLEDIKVLMYFEENKEN